MLFQIVANRDIAVAPRHAASIYLKNFARKYWKDKVDKDTGAVVSKFAEAERALIRDNIVTTAVMVEVQSIRVQLGVILQKIADEEFPGAWPGFVTSILGCMNSGEAQAVTGGLFLLEVLAKMVPSYRNSYSLRENPAAMAEARNVTDQFVAAALPLLATLAQQILSSGSFTADMGSMLKLVTKIYWNFVSMTELPTAAAETASFQQWQQILLQA